MMMQSLRLHSFDCLGIISKRTFFASSTDHTQLLKTAVVHSLPPSSSTETSDVYTYVLVPAGMDLQTVKAVPKLQLARLFRKENTIYGAKVVNRTLGRLDLVCPRLVQAAKADTSGQLLAKATLHGLADYVAAATAGKGDEKDYDEAVWDQLATQFIKEGRGEEANLYLKEDAVLKEIQHHADDSEFRKESGGAMAVFTL